MKAAKNYPGVLTLTVMGHKESAQVMMQARIW